MEGLLGVVAGKEIFEVASSHMHDGDENAPREYLWEVLAQIDLEAPLKREVAFKAKTAILTFEVDLGRPIGTSTVVQLRPGDNVFYAQRGGRTYLSRFVAGREPEPTSFVTLVLQAISKSETKFFVKTCYIGPYVGREPGDPSATEQERANWANRAFVDDGNYDPETRTSECPWE